MHDIRDLKVHADTTSTTGPSSMLVRTRKATSNPVQVVLLLNVLVCLYFYHSQSPQTSTQNGARPFRQHCNLSTRIKSSVMRKDLR